MLTGVLIGLGTATKLYPLFLLGGVLVICLRERRMRDFACRPPAPRGAWVVANLPAYLTGREQWQVFWTFNSDRGADLGSLWLVLAQARDPALRAEHHQRRLVAVLRARGASASLVLGLRAPETPRLAQLGFLIVAGFLLVNKVYSPQYVLWLLPLAVLARPRWRDLLIWQAGEVFYFAMRLVVPRGPSRPRGRRRRRVLLAGDRGAGRCRALPRGHRGSRHAAARGTTRSSARPVRAGVPMRRCEPR